MKRIVASPPGAFVELFASPMFRRLRLTCVEAADAGAVLAAVDQTPPSLVLVDGARPDMDVMALCQELRHRPAGEGVRLVAVLRRAEAEGAPGSKLIAAGCDAVVAWSKGPDPIAQQLLRLLDLPHRVARRRAASLPVQLRSATRKKEATTSRRSFLRLAPRAIVAAGEQKPVTGRAVDVSETGVRVVVEGDHGFKPGDAVILTLVVSGEPTEMKAHVAWRGEERMADGFSIGVQFDELDQRGRDTLASVLYWETHRLPTGYRVVFHDDLMPDRSYQGLLQVLDGHVVFDLAEARYLHPDAVDAWVDFLERLGEEVDSLTFTRCSVALLAEAAHTPEVLGGAAIQSFCLSTACSRCSWQEELLVRPEAAGALDDLLGSRALCPRCGHATRMEEVPPEARELLRRLAG